jgi:hypothetical protein
MIPKSIISFSFLLLIFTGCSSDPLDVSIEDVSVPTRYIHLDSLFVNSNDRELMKVHQSMLSESPEIYEFELGYCLRFGNSSDTALVNGLRLFLADTYIKRLEKRIEEQFSQMETYKTEITKGLRHLKVHFPKGLIPEHVVFMNSLFMANAFSTERQIGIGLERYLGSKTDVIKELPGQEFPLWMREAMDKQYLSRDALASWIMTHYIAETKGNLAEEMVRWGKVLYLVRAAFPDKDPSWIMRYSKEDYKWAKDNEYAFWKYLVEQKMLFKTDESLAADLLKEGPFTPGLPEKGPDRLGQFLGLQIIERYMENKEVTLEQLIKTPYSTILVEYDIE